MGEIFLGNREYALAIRTACAALELDPFRETSYQRLMRYFAASGNRAEALLAYERCRKLLAQELGADPSPQTESVYLSVLRQAAL